MRSSLGVPRNVASGSSTCTGFIPVSTSTQPTLVSRSAAQTGVSMGSPSPTPGVRTRPLSTRQYPSGRRYRRTLLHRAQRETADQVSSYKEPEDERWDDPQGRRRKHLPPVHAEGAEELRDHRGEGLRDVPREHERVEELVPGEDEHEDPGGHQPRDHLRQRDTGKNAQRREAV